MKEAPQSSYGLSPIQEGMLFDCLRSESRDVYIEQIVIDIPEPLNVLVLEKAWNRIMDQYDVLRTSFEWKGLAEPIQKVHQEARITIDRCDGRSWPLSERGEKTQAILRADRQRGYDLRKAPLTRIILIEFGGADYCLIFSHHHIVMDGRSVITILQDVFDFYDATCQGQELVFEPARPYRDYVEWVRRQDPPGAAKFWSDKLKGFSAPTSLPTDYALDDSSLRSETKEQRETWLSTELTAELETLCRREDLTMNILVQGAWAILLSRYSGEQDVVFGASKTARRSSVEGADSIVGMILNTLPVRVAVCPETPVRQWLKHLRAEWLSMRPYEHVPLVKIKEWSELPAGASMFDSLVQYEYQQFDLVLKSLDRRWRKCNVRYFGGSNYSLTLLSYGGAKLLLQLEYDSRRFESSTIDRMLVHLQTLLQGIAANPEERVSKVPLLTESERQQLLVEWNDTRVDYAQEVCLHELIEAQVERTPEAVAVVFEDRQISYSELNRRANQLAHYLRKLGMGPEVLVGVCMERSIEMVVGLLGILKAGGAYVPLDPEYPPERLAGMLEDCAAPVVLTQQRLQKKLPPHSGRTIRLDSDWAEVAKESAAELASGVGPDNACYAIYTSGSTGKPKGVLNLHKGIVNRLLWMQEAYRLTPADRVMQKTPYSFDVSVWEFFWPLLTGASMVVARPGGHKDVSYLVDLISAQKITTMHFVPSMLREFLESEDLGKRASLKRVICSGEALPMELQEKFFSVLGAELHNLYGPTEAAVDVTYWNCLRRAGWRLCRSGGPSPTHRFTCWTKISSPCLWVLLGSCILAA